MTDQHETLGCLLAGGLSRRMGGGDKCLLTLGGRTLLSHAIDRLGTQTGGLVLSANGDPARFTAYDLPVLPDPIEGYAGPLAGVLAGLLHARDNAPDAHWVVSAASDTPFFPIDLVARFLDAAGHDRQTIALAASGDRVHPVFGLWPVALTDDLRDWLANGESRKVLDWVARHQSVEVHFRGPVLDGVETDPFFNINTPEDMETATAVLEGSQQ